MNVTPDDAAEALPGPLPPGEHILWAARPARRDVLRHLLRFRVFLGLCALLAVWPVVAALDGGYSLPAALPAALLFIPVSLPVILFLRLIARIVANHTLYVVTDRRVIFHVGYVFTRTVNIPLAQVREAKLRLHSGGVGDIQLDISPHAPVGYAALAPHARLVRILRPTPLMRVVPEARAAALALTDALMRARPGMRHSTAEDVDAAGALPA
ncbi:photosynthetic complex putative assembly protein PuhB [Tranquillimonas alkanivorans]|uniref:PH domain-containing protein n=1 Tax=Tranquillimonas alkanivorans TaxID=441119 RepID=A0A1I5MYN3_9RHOB|nr:photosynthetic complex putative assembly protein PuhB [Tranquillimonas alkanivorans]SFP14599.1 PH domain-containing protein [Tranquillimonas alkanivorans]